MTEEDQKRLRKRLAALKELHETEQDYVRDLEMITQTFLQPLSQKILNKQDCSAIFSNLDIILNINRFFLTQMNQRMAESGSENIVLGDILLKLADFLKVYTVYVGNQEKCITTFQHCKQTNENFNNFLKEAAKKPECRGLDFISFLIKPVQRICKYPLLIREILTNTPTTDPDYPALKQLMAKFEEVTSYVNEHKRKAENQQEILLLANKLAPSTKFPSIVAPSRVLLHSGPCTRLSEGLKKDRKDAYLFLFNDLLLETSTLKKGLYTQRLHLPLPDLSFRSLTDTTPSTPPSNSSPSSSSSNCSTTKFLFEIIVGMDDGEVSIVYSAPSQADKDTWAEKLQTNIKEASSTLKCGKSGDNNCNLLHVRGLSQQSSSGSTLSPRALASALQRALKPSSSSSSNKSSTLSASSSPKRSKIVRSAPISPVRSQPFLPTVNLKDLQSEDEQEDEEEDDEEEKEKENLNGVEKKEEAPFEKDDGRPLTRSRSSGLPKFRIEPVRK
eukprot:TRINITY_DN6164_c0_g1_i1.p1 TRINITY_DN6164_c0_g1~~TRINITY_DN6164_c0_g1_i1.p1  ORF type:complete len:501 (+),score=137.81 TRINITY_DN6164_c0_g1_i1:64-1566(+)